MTPFWPLLAKFLASLVVAVVYLLLGAAAIGGWVGSL